MSGPYTQNFSLDEIDPRITVHEGRQTVEIDLSGLYFHTSKDVNALFDRIEERLQETGEPLWFFLDNVTDYRVDESAWFAFTRRGRDLNQAHSMGTLRYDTTPETRARIARDKGTDRESPNLFADRAAALAHLSRLPSRRRERIHHHPNHERGRFMRRLSFDETTRIFDIDLSGVSFEHSRDVNDIYDWLEQALRRAGGRWYFLINYENTRIQSPAWVKFAARGKDLNERFSLGSVRYAPDSETEADIRLRAESGGFRPNIRNTRAEALARIAEMKSGAQVA
ncbi:hypothetical protein [Salibaculum sp.]|uniref:hypothetical protein n=1 Tax=Salibaculum sp. TaxID=2855480 RepID=UPI002B4859DF|nr:hypothetical protein [Salibaculum sp.]HKL69050.1 hypothetical protein [Salibaculum sp.]